MVERRGARKFSVVDRRHLETLPELRALDPELVFGMRVVAEVLPFRTNPYVVEELIDWNSVPDDPIFRLTFPHPDMLEPADFDAIAELLRAGAPRPAVEARARAVRARLNPHPAGQAELNVPVFGGAKAAGIQHKYRETVLFFPAQGQTCHAYCTYCFRWPQFVGDGSQRFASQEADLLVEYLRAHPGVTSVLFTGGDPLVMRTDVLRRYIEPLLAADLPALASIRIGTKSVAYWPQRFTTDTDADDLLRLFESVVRSGKTLALMGHYTHPRELETETAQTALRRIQRTGAVVRCQAPIVRHVNDDALVWSELWHLQVALGAVPYYMFVERDTGPRHYFEVPLARAYEIYRDAIARVSGLGRTARGPSMSATPGKVCIDGVAEIHGEKVFVLRFLQARDPSWIGRPFFAAYDESATWLDQLRPALGEREFFFEAGMRACLHNPLEAGWRSEPISRRHLVVIPEVA